MKIKGHKPNNTSSGVPDAPVVVVFDSSTGRLVSEDEFQGFCASFLKDCGCVQKELIIENVNVLPQRGDDDFGSKWARDNVIKPDSVEIPKDYIEKFWTLTGDKIEAARLILAHRERDRVASAFDELGWDASCDDVKELISPDKYLDWRLVKNIKESGKHPELPHIKRPRFPYNQMNNQVCQQVAFSDVVFCHNMAVGKKRFDVIFYMGDLESRYHFIEKVSRPTMRLDSNGHVAFDFSVIESVPVRDACRGHVVTFDRNTDHEHVISGARMNRDGTISRELGPSVDTLSAINRLKKWQVERERCRKKLSNLMPDHDPESRQRLINQEKHLGELIANEKERVDWMEVDDIRCHVLPDEVLGVEQLDMFGGGYVKFRHGSTDDKLEHATARDGGLMTHVNPSGTSTSCPECRKRMKKGDDGIERCPNCGYETPHDYGANVLLGIRTFKKIGSTVTVKREDLPSVEVQEERSKRCREKREAKMERRAERGAKTYRIKDKPTPRRPKRGARKAARKEERVERQEPAMSLKELRDLFTREYEAQLAGVGGERKESELEKDAGSLCSVAPLPPWDLTNSFVSGLGWSTCYAFFEDLYVRSMLNGKIRSPESLDEDGTADSSDTCLQENLSNS